MSALTDTPRLDSERTTADLRFCGEQFESIRSDIEELTSGLDERQLGWQPTPSTWSIAQCIEHLSSVTESDLVRLHALIAVASALRLGRRGPVLSATPASAPGRHAITLHEPPRHSFTSIATQRSAAPEADPAAATERFLILNRRLLEVIERAGTLAAGLPSEHAGVQLLDLVGHALQLNALHHWRFILQARRLTERPAFPHR